MAALAGLGIMAAFMVVLVGIPFVVFNHLGMFDHAEDDQ